MQFINLIIKLDYMHDLIFTHSRPTMHYWYMITLYILLKNMQAFCLHWIWTINNIGNSGGRKWKCIFGHQTESVQNKGDYRYYSLLQWTQNTNCVNHQWQRFTQIDSNLVTGCPQIISSRAVTCPKLLSILRPMSAKMPVHMQVGYKDLFCCQ